MIMHVPLSSMGVGLRMVRAGNDDVITLKAADNGDSISLMFESPKQDRISGACERGEPLVLCLLWPAGGAPPAAMAPHGCHGMRTAASSNAHA